MPQIFVVGRNQLRASLKKLAVPKSEQGQHHRHIRVQWGMLEVFIHGMAAGKKLAEMINADGDQQRQSDR